MGVRNAFRPAVGEPLKPLPLDRGHASHIFGVDRGSDMRLRGAIDKPIVAQEVALATHPAADDGGRILVPAADFVAKPMALCLMPRTMRSCGSKVPLGQVVLRRDRALLDDVSDPLRGVSRLGELEAAATFAEADDVDPLTVLRHSEVKRVQYAVLRRRVSEVVLQDVDDARESLPAAMHHKTLDVLKDERLWRPVLDDASHIEEERAARILKPALGACD